MCWSYSALKDHFRIYLNLGVKLIDESKLYNVKESNLKKNNETKYGKLKNKGLKVQLKITFNL